MQEPHAHEEVQVLVPVEPHEVMQLPVEPLQQANPLSHVPSQSSSMPLHVSAGGLHAPQLHVALQILVPVEPQPVGQDSVEPRQQANPLSHAPSQSSSMPLHVSAGGVQSAGDGMVQSSPHTPVPALPHVVVQLTEVPITQSNVSSAAPLQLSSIPLHISGPEAHALPVGISQVEEHIPLPSVPQSVMQSTSTPLGHGKPLSTAPSQSSSTPLHVSSGGLQLSGEG